MEKETQQTIENQEWLKSFQWVVDHESTQRAAEILRLLAGTVAKNNISFGEFNTPYINTFSPIKESEYPGNIEIEKNLLPSFAGMQWQWL